MISITVVLLSIAIFAALVINMALKPSYSAKLTAVLILLSACGGSVIYGLGYTYVTKDIALSLIRTPFSVIGMYLGKNDLSAISGAPVVSTSAGIICFWALHLFAFYSIASTAIITVGAEGLRRLRLFLAMNGDLTIIYGINEESLDVGRECLAEGRKAIVFITNNELPAQTKEINELGMAVLTGTGAARSSREALARLRVRSRNKIEVFALDADGNENMSYAAGLMKGLQQMEIDPRITSITLPGTEDILTEMLQVSEERYGFGFVNVFDSTELAARAMISLCPPWEFLSFDKGRATEDFDCIVVGFGKCGQAALRYLVMNGQFAGSQFRAAVFSPNFKKESGYLRSDCPEMLRQYEIESFEEDARGAAFYNYIEQRLSTLKLIAVATGDPNQNREISDSLMLFLKRRKAENICVVRCDKSGVRYQERIGSPILTSSIYSRACLSAKDADCGAIVLNASYDGSERSDWEKWLSCDSFGRMSSRASADFAHAFLRAAGCTKEEVLAGTWAPSETLLRTLGETEHLRWMAFHFAMGYRLMSKEQFAANEEVWRRCREEGVPCPIKLSKNAEERTHACLIDWDALDELSARESAITGREVDYQQMDINNVLTLPRLLQAEEGKRNK